MVYYCFLNMCIQIPGCCIAYDGGHREPIKMSRDEFDVYKTIFMGILVNSNQLIIEPRPIGEGNCSEIITNFDFTPFRSIWCSVWCHPL